MFNAKSETVIVMTITSQEPGAGFPLTLDPRNFWVTETVMDQNLADPDDFGAATRKEDRASTRCRDQSGN
jgi:hypothetical protein